MRVVPLLALGMVLVLATGSVPLTIPGSCADECPEEEGSAPASCADCGCCYLGAPTLPPAPVSAPEPELARPASELSPALIPDGSLREILHVPRATAASR